MSKRRSRYPARRSVPQKSASKGWTLWVGIAVAVVAAVAVTVWAATRDGGAGDNRASSEGDAGVVHIHGLGINPKDNTLYAATHTGLFRIPTDGKVERVGGRYQDTMGFTIVGPDRFLGSGHPDLKEMREKKLPPLLGLIESTDAGRTWQTLSLRGEADFHGLRALHGRVYGYDSTSTTFMVSADGKTWDRRAKLAILDFAVSPDNADMVIATTPAGVQRSGDGGRTWQRINAPPLALVAWEKPGEIWGFAQGGAVYQSSDAGATWQQRGTVAGNPAAFLATGGVLYAAAHDGSIYQSEDGGRSWSLRYREQGPSRSSRQ